MTLKTAVVPPMPRARQTMAAAASSGRRRKVRKADKQSSIMGDGRDLGTEASVPKFWNARIWGQTPPSPDLEVHFRGVGQDHFPVHRQRPAGFLQFREPPFNSSAIGLFVPVELFQLGFGKLRLIGGQAAHLIGGLLPASGDVRAWIGD